MWVVEQSRLERREVGWFELAAELDAAGIRAVHTNRDGIVTVGDVVAGIKAVLNAAEVRTMKKRLNETLAERAAEGRPAGATPFGYRHGLDADGGKTYIQIPEQVDAIRYAAERVLAGWSLSNVAAALRARGLVGPHRRWTRDENGTAVSSRPTEIRAQSVRRMVTNYAVAGLRLHKGQVTKGVWEPILDEPTWQAVRAKLGAPRTVTRIDGGTYPVTAMHRGPGGRRYLLTGGLAVCGVCGAPLRAQMKQLRNGSKPYYLCHPREGGRACVGILGSDLEQYVVDTLMERLNSADFLEGLKGDDEDAARRDQLVAALAAIDVERNEIAAMRGTGDLSLAEWQSFRKGLTEREQRLRAELASVPVPVSIIDPARITADWDVMTLDERREVVGMFVSRVTVHRARPGSRSFDPGRVVIA